MTEQSDCFVCRKHRSQEAAPGGPIYQNNLIYASHVAPPLGEQTYLGWCLVEPRRHVPGLGDLTDEEAQAVGLLAARLSRALRAELGAEHVYAFALGHHVPHLHLHVIARHPGTPREYWGLRVDEWPDAPKGNEAEVVALVGRLQARFSQP